MKIIYDKENTYFGIYVDRIINTDSYYRKLSKLELNFKEKEIDFIVTNQGIDTSKKQNLDLFSMITVFSEFEMNLRLERQLEGIQKAKESGVRFGRKPIDNRVIQNVKKLFLDGMSVGQISIKLALGRSTIYRLLK